MNLTLNFQGISNEVWLGLHHLNGTWTNYALGELEGRKLLKFGYKKWRLEQVEGKNKTGDEFNVPRRAGMTFIATFTLGNSTHPKPYDTFIGFDGWKKVTYCCKNITYYETHASSYIIYNQLI